MHLPSFIPFALRGALPAAVAVLLALPVVAPIAQAAPSVDYCSITRAQTQDSTYSVERIKGIQSKVNVTQSGAWDSATINALCTYQQNSCAASPVCNSVSVSDADIAALGNTNLPGTIPMDEATAEYMATAPTTGVNNGPCTGKTGQDLLRCHLVEPSKGDAERYEGKDETSLVRFVISLVTGLIGTIALIFIFINVFRLMTADGDEGAFSQAIRSIAFGAVGMILAGAAYAIMGAIIDIDILP